RYPEKGRDVSSCLWWASTSSKEQDVPSHGRRGGEPWPGKRTTRSVRVVGAAWFRAPNCAAVGAERVGGVDRQAGEHRDGLLWRTREAANELRTGIRRRVSPRAGARPVVIDQSWGPPGGPGEAGLSGPCPV